MADQPTPSNPNGGSGADGGQGQPQTGPSPLFIKAQYIKDFSFENPRAPASLAPLPNPPSVQISVNVSAQRLGETDYEVSLTINADAKAGNDALFVAELQYGGLIGIGDVPQEHVRALLLIEAPRLLFPFARNIIADATREGGFPPLLIQPVDFVELYRRDLANQQGGRPA